MLVHFSASARNIKEDIVVYRKILTAIRQSGHSIAHDWIETAWLMTQGKGRDANGWDLNDIVLEVEAGIEAAEVVIVEASATSTFGVGYELALALQKRKPILVLIREESINDSYAAALRSDLMIIKLYSQDNLESIINKFLTENNIKTKDLRFNFVIDRQIYSHLKAKSFKTGRTKAEVVRDLIARDMQDG